MTMTNDYSPKLLVTHCLRDTDGNWFLMMWHADDHHIYAFESTTGISKIKGIDETEFDTFEDACKYLEDTIQEVPMPQG